MRYVLDAGVLGAICHPRANLSIIQRFRSLLDDPRNEVFVAEIADYELRRKFLHLIPQNQIEAKSLERLDALGISLTYVAISTSMMRQAADLWAMARTLGRPGADDKALDADVILAAQALAVGATIITTNPRHFELFTPVEDWPASSS